MNYVGLWMAFVTELLGIARFVTPSTLSRMLVVPRSWILRVIAIAVVAASTAILGLGLRL